MTFDVSQTKRDVREGWDYHFEVKRSVRCKGGFCGVASSLFEMTTRRQTVIIFSRRAVSGKLVKVSNQGEVRHTI